MHGVTGRMGTNQHLVRSILEIRKQGGVRLADGTRLMPDPILVGRNAEKLRGARAGARHRALDDGSRRRRWRTGRTRCFSTPLHAAAAEAAQAGDRGRQARLLRKAGGDDARGRARHLSRREEGARQARRRAGQALAAGPAEARRSWRDAGFFGRILSVRGEFGYWVFEGDAHGSPRRSARPGTTARRTAAASSSTCCATGATCSTICSARCRRSPAAARRTFRTAGTRTARSTGRRRTMRRTRPSSWRAGRSRISTARGACGCGATIC